MAIVKEEKTFRELTDQRLPTSSRLNLFNIQKDTKDGVYFNNMFRFFHIDDGVKHDSSFFDIYIALEDEWWDNIADKFYGSSTLWYIITAMNDVFNPYEQLIAGQQVKVLKKEYLYDVFKSIKSTSEL